MRKKLLRYSVIICYSLNPLIYPIAGAGAGAVASSKLKSVYGKRLEFIESTCNNRTRWPTNNELWASPTKNDQQQNHFILFGFSFKFATETQKKTQVFSVVPIYAILGRHRFHPIFLDERIYISIILFPNNFSISFSIFFYLANRVRIFHFYAIFMNRMYDFGDLFSWRFPTKT